MFDQSYHQYLLTTNPAAAAQYVAQFTAPAAAAPVQHAQPAAPAPQVLQGTLAPPAPQLARGTLEDFDDQVVGGGGPSVTKFHNGRPEGSWVHVRIPRDLTNNDVRQQTEFKTNLPKTFKNGDPKFDLWIPLEVIATSDPAGSAQLFPEGTAVAYLKPDRGDGLKSTVSRALSAIGNPDGLRTGILGGTELVISSAGLKPNGTPNPTKLWQVQAFPTGIPQAAAPAAAPVAPVPAMQAAPAPITAAPSAPAVQLPASPVMAPVPSAAPATPAAPATAAVAPHFIQPVLPGTTQVPAAPNGTPQVTVNGETKEELLARLNAAR